MNTSFADMLRKLGFCPGQPARVPRLYMVPWRQDALLSCVLSGYRIEWTTWH